MGKGVTKTVPQIFRDNICTAFNLLNAIIAIVLVMVGAWKNILFIFAILINTTVGIIQEMKTKRRIEQLTILSLSKSKIIRDGKETEVMPYEIKKGDTLCLESGMAVSCDCKIKSGTAEINESVLTGESEPVQKRNGDEILSGSTVISGRCRAEVICESEDGFAARIVDEVKSTKQTSSEMPAAMDKVTKFTSLFILPLGILLFIQGYFFRDMSFSDTVVTTSAGLLGMLPKGLVLLMSIGFAAGIIRLSKENVLVRELYSLENLAHCDVVCLDKTGTLTTGELAVERVLPNIDKAEFEKLMSTYIKFTDDNNSTYIALKNYFGDAAAYECIDCEPFSSERKYSSVTLDNGMIFVIGAPEKLCRTIPDEVSEIMSKGARVIVGGICRGEITYDNIKVVGMVVISDTIRDTANETIKYFYSQDIDVKIISGDNPRAVSAVAKNAGVRNAESFIDMSDFSEDEINDIADKYTVFGRVTPKQKKMLIEAMQNAGHKVAMTGDGVNDLLAMRRADCSVAMGSGCDAARRAAQLVLLDSDFSVLKDVISEGRRVVNNLTKSAGVFFIKTIYSILLCVLCLLFNSDFPFIPIQITLIDAVIEGFPAFFMSFEKNDEKCEKDFLTAAIRRAFPNGVAVFACCVIIFGAIRFMGFDSAQGSLIMYLAVGFISLAGVIKASLPLNWFRGLLTLMSGVGFVCAVIVFDEFLQLPSISRIGAVALVIVTAVGILIARYVKIPKEYAI